MFALVMLWVKTYWMLVLYFIAFHIQAQQNNAIKLKKLDSVEWLDIYKQQQLDEQRLDLILGPNKGGISTHTLRDLFQKIAPRENDIKYQQKYLITEADLYFQEGNLDTSILLYKTLLQSNLVTKAYDSALIIKNIMGLMGQKKMHFKVFQLNEKLKEMEPRIRKTNPNYKPRYKKLSDNYGRLGMYQEAIELLRPEVFKLLKDSSALPLGQTTILADYYLKLNNPDSALYFLDQLEQQFVFFEKRGSRIRSNHKGRMQRIKARAFLYKGKYTTALNWAQKSDKSYADYGFQREDVHLLTANILMSLDRWDEAKEELILAKKIISGRKEEDITQITEYHQLQSRLEEHFGQTKLALFHHKQYTHFKDSQEVISRENIALGKQLSFQVNLSKEKLNMSNESLKLAKKEKELKTLQRNALIGLLLILSAFLVYLFINLRRKNQRAEMLYQQNKEIERQKSLINNALEEKNLLLKEVHHRVKNNLQVVSGFLKLQARKFEKTAFAEAMEDGRNRIQVMSSIHQMFYKSENLNEINMGNFIQELITKLKISYSKKNSELVVNVDVEERNFSIDLAINLGLVTNEVLVNIFKHAFHNSVKNPTIWIRLSETNRGSYILEIKDNGCGINLAQLPENTLGLNLVAGLARQMDATYQFTEENGTTFQLTFNSPEK